MNSPRNLNLIRLDLVGITPTQRNRPFRPMQSFLERDQNVGFNVTTPLCSGFPPSKSASAKSTASAAASKKCLEEVTKPGPAKFEFDPTISATRPVESSTGLLPFPSRGWLKSAWLIPVGAQLVVLLSFLRIPKDLVRFIDLFKFFLSCRFVFVNVGMVLAGELAKCLTNFVIAGRLWDAQCFVVISELYSHRMIR